MSKPDIRMYISAATLDRAKKTMWWEMADLLSDLLYNAHDGKGGSSGDGTITVGGPSPRADDAVWVAFRQFSFEPSEGRPWSSDSGRVDRLRLLRHVQAELERLAVLEATK